eukprot:TRINITY_DN7527_c0_g2_i2.p1 TRINITY_DN7527_c0_g2~~TRINITY_DN7527_c0_g2_i2.p1  ORF type:complete len:228 (+),score=15.89 TRINITY_DN7527_c0_g2_i2:68-685(+)
MDVARVLLLLGVLFILFFVFTDLSSRTPPHHPSSYSEPQPAEYRQHSQPRPNYKPRKPFHGFGFDKMALFELAEATMASDEISFLLEEFQFERQVKSTRVNRSCKWSVYTDVKSSSKELEEQGKAYLNDGDCHSACLHLTESAVKRARSVLEWESCGKETDHGHYRAVDFVRKSAEKACSCADGSVDHDQKGSRKKRRRRRRGRG